MFFSGADSAFGTRPALKTDTGIFKWDNTS